VLAGKGLFKMSIEVQACHVSTGKHGLGIYMGKHLPMRDKSAVAKTSHEGSETIIQCGYYDTGRLNASPRYEGGVTIITNNPTFSHIEDTGYQMRCRLSFV